MSERARFVFEWERQTKEAGRVNMAALCRAFQIKRQTGYKWVARYFESGRRLSSLEDQSRRPKHSPSQISSRVEWAIVKARKIHPHWGARKLRDWLLRTGWKRISVLREEIPVASTIGAVLRRNNLTRPRRVRRKTPPYSSPFSHCNSPNAVWCVDFKGWFRTGDGSVCYPLTLMDACSRKLLRCEAVEAPDFKHVKAIFESAFEEFGLPTAIRSDNGPPFATVALAGFSELSLWWAELGVRHERITPGKPQENGRHERMHRTLKEATAMPPAETLVEQQARFDEFLRVYNAERPHEALDGAVPDDLYEPSPRRFSKKNRPAPMTYGDDCEVRRVDANGTVKLRGKRKFRVGAVFSRRKLGFRPVGIRQWEVLFGDRTLGILDEDDNSRIIGQLPKRLLSQIARENLW